MTINGRSWRRWYQFTLGQLLMLTLGIAIGFVPLKLWELRQGPRPQLLIRMQIVEVPRHAFPSLGIDASADSAAPLRDSGAVFSSRLESLRRENKIKVLAEPTLVTVTGQRASFVCGGEFPAPIAAEDGTVAVQYREFGRASSYVPRGCETGGSHSILDAQISQIDDRQTLVAAGLPVPAIRTRSVRTQLEVMEGETIAFAGFGEKDAASDSLRETLVVATIEKLPRR